MSLQILGPCSGGNYDCADSCRKCALGTEKPKSGTDSGIRGRDCADGCKKCALGTEKSKSGTASGKSSRDCADSCRKCASGTKKSRPGTAPGKRSHDCADSCRKCALGTKKSKSGTASGKRSHNLPSAAGKEPAGGWRYRQPGEPKRKTAGTETGAIQVVDFSEYVSETGRILCGRAYLPRAH